MRSRYFLGGLLAMLLLSACDSGFQFDGLGGDSIGEKLKDVSSLNTESGQEVNKVVVYDPTVSRLHQFDLNTMQVERSLAVLKPGVPHTLLYDSGGNYVVDFTEKNMTIFDRYNRPQNDPLRCVGEPKSAAFRPSAGLLVVYDSVFSVGILKLSPDGEVLKSWKGGADIHGFGTVSAGDLDSSGRLILALDDGQMVAIDPNQVLADRAWPATVPFATGIRGIDWVSPIPGQPDLVMVSSDRKLAVVDVVLGGVVGSVLELEEPIVKRSKRNSPHVIVRELRTGNLRVYYADGNHISDKMVQEDNGLVVFSRLDLTGDSFSLVVAHPGTNIFRNFPKEQEGRILKQWQFSNMDAIYEEKIEDNSKMEMATRSFFVLKPSKLGHAINYDLLTNTKAEAKAFNLKYIY